MHVNPAKSTGECRGSTFKIERRWMRVWGAQEVVPPGQARVAPLVERGDDVGRQVGVVRLCAPARATPVSQDLL